MTRATPEPVLAATLPRFTNCAIYARCGNRREIRAHFDPDCWQVRGAHFHRICPCGYRWIERGTEELLLDHQQ